MQWTLTPQKLPFPHPYLHIHISSYPRILIISSYYAHILICSHPHMLISTYPHILSPSLSQPASQPAGWPAGQPASRAPLGAKCALHSALCKVPSNNFHLEMGPNPRPPLHFQTADVVSKRRAPFPNARPWMEHLRDVSKRRTPFANDGRRFQTAVPVSKRPGPFLNGNRH